ncbi:TraB/GumN family protein [Thermaurantiacus sp.]
MAPVALAWLVALLWAIASPADAQRGTPSPAAPALWVLRDSDTTVHLFGTVHALPRGLPWFRRHVVEALDASDQLVLEALVPEDPLGTMGLTIRMGRAPLPRPVLDRVPADRRAELQAALDRLKPGDLSGFDTWYIALALANLQTLANGFDPATGAEAVLTERARMRGVRIVGLETPEQQLGLFKALPEADQQQFLLSTLDELSTSKADLDATIADWMAGRKDEIAERLNREFESSPMLKQMLLGDRNARWAAWIAERMASPGKLFVAVGAGHLAGKDSLIEDLKRYGLNAERVTEPPPPARSRRR